MSNSAGKHLVIALSFGFASGLLGLGSFGLIAAGMGWTDINDFICGFPLALGLLLSLAMFLLLEWTARK
jgi:uncharacterized membrane protein